LQYNIVLNPGTFCCVFTHVSVVLVALFGQSAVSQASSTVERGRDASCVHVTVISQSQDRISASTVPATLRPIRMAPTPARSVKVPLISLLLSSHQQICGYGSPTSSIGSFRTELPILLRPLYLTLYSHAEEVLLSCRSFEEKQCQRTGSTQFWSRCGFLSSFNYYHSFITQHSNIAAATSSLP